MTKDYCDICKKQIENREYVTADYRWAMMRHMFCLKCGKSIFNFLKKHKFIEKK